jgi:hypothetical protein
MDAEEQPVPQARQDGLVVRELPGEVLVYDLERRRSHCLNRAAALVWQHCDGRTPIAGLAALLQRELNVPVDEDAVWLALDRLGRARLLQQRLELPATAVRYSRRTLVRRLAVAGGLALVTSIVAPEARAAGSVGSCITCTPGQSSGCLSGEFCCDCSTQTPCGGRCLRLPLGQCNQGQCKQCPGCGSGVGPLQTQRHVFQPVPIPGRPPRGMMDR